MKKLETLRDIELYHKINPDVKDDYDVLYDELKEAAREWIKEIDNAILNNKAISHKPFWEKDKEILGDAWIAHYFSVRAWIKHFFNLE